MTTLVKFATTELWGKLGLVAFGALLLLQFLGVDAGAMLTGKYTDEKVAVVAEVATANRTSIGHANGELQRLGERLDGQAKHGSVQDGRLSRLELGQQSLRDRWTFQDRQQAAQAQAFKEMAAAIGSLARQQAVANQRLRGIESRLDRALRFNVLPQQQAGAL